MRVLSRIKIVKRIDSNVWLLTHTQSLDHGDTSANNGQPQRWRHYQLGLSIKNCLRAPALNMRSACGKIYIRNATYQWTTRINSMKIKKRECIVYLISGYHKQCTKCLTKKPKCLSIIVYHILVCTNNNYHYARNGSEHFIASDAHTLNSTFIHISFLVTFHGWDFCVYLCFRGSLH